MIAAMSDLFMAKNGLSFISAFGQKQQFASDSSAVLG